VKPLAFVAGRDLGKPVGGLEFELVDKADVHGSPWFESLRARGPAPYHARLAGLGRFGYTPSPRGFHGTSS
jgi:hypothetical protein